MTGNDLPVGDHPDPIPLPHFPTRQQAVLWRNWGLVDTDRLARVLGTTPGVLRAEAERMGLDPAPDVNPRWLERGYVTLIRANWHLLPYDQLLELLGWSARRMDFALREDDFLWHKLGNLKPAADPVAWRRLTDTERAATEYLRETVRRYLPDGLARHEPAFAFLDQPGFGASVNRVDKTPRFDFDLRMAYSYAAVCGDPLLDAEHDPYPDSLLEAYAASGVNAVWLHGLLYALTPLLPQVCDGYDRRLETLRDLVERAGRFGIDVLLYLNEPRGMGPSFFEHYPDWRGAISSDGTTWALCTSVPAVLEYVRAASEHLAREVPGLGGVFTITMSENVTSCFSKGMVHTCPRCAEKPFAPAVAEVNRAIERGIHAGAPDARVIVWTWAWDPSWSGEAIDLLPERVELMCVSEWGKQIDIGGVPGSIVDYSISQPGPSREAQTNWRRAHRRGLKTVAKVQVNNSWECSAVPWLPVPHLVEEHLDNLARAGVGGLMLSWTLGGYPAGNIPLLYHTPAQLAAQLAPTDAGRLESAWAHLAEAFRQFPFHVGVLYTAPQNAGPRNLLHGQPTGYRATMVGYPYDDLDRWRAEHYPRDVFVEQCRKLSHGWDQGLTQLSQIESDHPDWPTHLRMAEAAGCHFRSLYLQSAFVDRRDRGEGNLDELVRAELENTLRLFDLAAADSRIGFEASNHYNYTLNDLAEKVLNCARLLGDDGTD